MSTIVVMPGGFHPFHAGHAALYNSARRAFPDAEVFVAATNDTSNRPFPFAIKEKLAKLAGVEAGHFVQVKSPFQAREITAQFNPEVDRLIFVRSEKDADKPPQAGGVKKDGSPSYLQPLLGAEKLEPFGKRAYMAYLPTVEFGPGMTSATEIRTAWPQLNDKRKQALVMSLYPKTQSSPALAANVVKMLDTAMGTEELTEFSFGSDDDDTPKDDPYKYPKPEQYRRSIDFFGKFEANHFDKEDMDDATGVFKGYWYYDGKPRQIAYFKFNNPQRTGSNDPGMGWYYEPQDEDIAEATKKCPPATQDITLNLKNRQKAIDEYGYGPLNPDMPNTKFWMAKVDEWNLDSTEEAKQSLCGNCAAFDIRQDTLDCIAQGIDSDNPADAEGVIDAGDLGYCKFLKFKCASRRTCDAWVTGGPLVDKTDIAEMLPGTSPQGFVGGMYANYQARENQPTNEDSDYIEEKWSNKYKDSINCANPKGFSQKAHCAGRKK